MKEMIYKNENIIQLLHNDIYKGYHYYIISRGYFPLAYVEIPKNHRIYGLNLDYLEDKINLPVNGGCTYSGSLLDLSKTCNMVGSWFVGWDYAHYSDYNGMFSSCPGHKWSTKEIISECLSAIDYLNEYK